MYTRILPEDWVKVDIKTNNKDCVFYQNTKDLNIIKEIKYDRHFKYYLKDVYVGRFNSNFSLFDDDIVVITLNSEY